MKFSLKSRASLGFAAAASTLVFAAGAAIAASASNPTYKPAKPAKSAGNIVLHVGDQAGTGAEAVLQAAGLIKADGSEYTLKGYPVKLEFNDFANGPAILTAIEGGSDQIGGVGDAPPVFADPGGGIVIVGQLQTGYLNAGLLVPKNSSITSIKDLKGKTVAVGTGTSADYHFLTVLKAAGLKPSDVNIVNASSGVGLADLESGSVQAFDTWSPYVEEGEALGFKNITVGQHYGANISWEVSSKTALKNKKDVAAIDDYLLVLNKAHTWANKHASVWAKAWAAQVGFKLSVMTRATIDDEEVPVAITSATVKAEQGIVDAFASAGLIPSKYKINPFITDAFNTAVSAKKG